MTASGVTGRSLHDALLRVLTDGPARQRLLAGGPRVNDAFGPEETRILRCADPDRLRGLARFMARHFYRERAVRLYRGGRALSLLEGRDPLAALETGEAVAVLDAAVLGSAATAEAIAGLIEAQVIAGLADRPWSSALVGYEGAMFRVGAGPRRSETDGGARAARPVRSPHARILALDWNVIPLLAALRAGTTPLLEPRREPTPLLIALSFQGRVTAVRCPEPVARFLNALNGQRESEEAAALAGFDEGQGRGLLAKLAEIGAVEGHRLDAAAGGGA